MMKYAFPLFLAAALPVAAGALASGVQQASPPPGPGLAIVNGKCGFCHSTSQVFSASHTAAEWPDVVQQMIDRGAELTPEEQSTVSTYLAANFASDKAAAPVTTGSQAPPGANAPAVAATGAPAKP